MQNGNRNGPAGESLERVATLTSMLIRQEVALAQAEIGEAASAAAMGLAMLAAAALLGTIGLVLLIVTLVLGLATAVPAWLAALLVGIAVLLIAAGLALFGRAVLRRVSPKPQKTIAFVKEDVQWLKQQTRSESKS